MTASAAPAPCTAWHTHESGLSRQQLYGSRITSSVEHLNRDPVLKGLGCDCLSSSCTLTTTAQMSVSQSVQGCKTASGFVVRQDNPEMLRERAEKWHEVSQSKAAETASGFWIQAAHNITKALTKHVEKWHTVNQYKAAETQLQGLDSSKSLTHHHRGANEAP